MFAVAAFVVSALVGLLLLLTVNSRLDRIERHQRRTRRYLMALSDEVKAFAEGVSSKVDAAVADIQALHAKLDEALNQGDVEGARAAIAAANEKLAALQAAVDLPE